METSHSIGSEYLQTMLAIFEKACKAGSDLEREECAKMVQSLSDAYDDPIVKEALNHAVLEIRRRKK